MADALPGINTALLGAATAQQREILQTSSLDEMLLDAERDARARAAAIAAREEPSLEPFLPTRGDGLLLSASDIETYRTCPLKYKFARVFRIPSEPTLNQRFGILVHQVLERYHQSGGRTIDEMLGLLEAAGGAAASAPPTRSASCTPRPTARCAATTSASATRTASRCGSRRPSASAWARTPCAGAWTASTACPTATTSSSTTRPGGRAAPPSCARTSSSRSTPSARARRGDCASSRQSYLYVLDDAKVPLPVEEVDRDWITETVFEVADGILAQGFEPTPSYAACSICDYRIACPAAER